MKYWTQVIGDKERPKPCTLSGLFMTSNRQHLLCIYVGRRLCSHAHNSIGKFTSVGGRLTNGWDCKCLIRVGRRLEGCHVVLVPNEDALAFLRVWCVTTLALANGMVIWSGVIEEPRDWLRRRQLKRVLLDWSLVELPRKGARTHVIHRIHEISLWCAHATASAARWKPD